jgi:hypothetical protein
MRRIPSVILLATALVAGGAAADEAPGFPDFTFRMVKPPPAGAQKRILVQIDPNAPPPPMLPRPPAPDPLPEGAATASGTADWFWQAVSPSIFEASPSRFETALLALDHAPAGQEITPPRLQAMQDLADAWGTEILKSTIGTSISPALVLAVMAVESGGNTGALSPAGAQGLMQLMPDTAARFGVTDPSSGAQSIHGAVAYLDWLMGHFGKDVLLALAGYNAGENAVTGAAGVPDYPETRAYVPKVLAAWRVARGLCLTPPDLPGDGCVFAAQRKEANDQG